MNHADQQKTYGKGSKKMTVRYWFQRIAGRFSLRLVFSLPFMLQFLTVTCLIGFLLFQGGQEAVGAVLGEMREKILGHVGDGIADRLMAGTTISLDTDYDQLVAAIKQIGEEGVRWDDVTVLCIQIRDVI